MKQPEVAEYVGVEVFALTQVAQQTDGAAQRISIKISPMSLRSKTGVESEPMNPRKLLTTAGRFDSMLLTLEPSQAITAPIDELEVEDAP